MWNKDYCPICDFKLEVDTDPFLVYTTITLFTSCLGVFCPILSEGPNRTHFRINYEGDQIIYELIIIGTFLLDLYPTYNITNIYAFKDNRSSFMAMIPYLKIDYNNLDKVREKLKLYTLFS